MPKKNLLTTNPPNFPPQNIWEIIFSFFLTDNLIGELVRFGRINKFFKQSLFFFFKKFPPTSKAELEGYFIKHKSPIFTSAFLDSRDDYGEWIFQNTKEWNLINKLFLCARNGKTDLFVSTLGQYKKRYKNKNIYDLLRNARNYFGESLYDEIALNQRQHVLDFVSQFEPIANVNSLENAKQTKLFEDDVIKTAQFSEKLAKKIFNKCNEYKNLEKAIIFNDTATINRILNPEDRILNLGLEIPNTAKCDLLILAISHGHAELFGGLLKRFGLELEALVNGAKLGKILFEKAVEHGAITALDEELKNYSHHAQSIALFFYDAIHKNDFKTVEYLYNKYSFYFNSARSYGEFMNISPFCFAIICGHIQIAKLLSEQKDTAKLTVVLGDHIYCSALSFVIKNNDEAMLKFLLKDENLDIEQELCFPNQLTEAKRANAIQSAISTANCSLEIKKLLYLEIAKRISLKTHKLKSDRDLLEYVFFNINTSLLGVVEIQLLLYKISNRATLSYNKGWLSQTLAEKTESIQRLANEAKTELNDFKNSETNEIQNSYQKLQKLFIMVESIDQKRGKSMLKGKKSSFSAETHYHEKLDPCISNMGSILLRSPKENYQIALDVKNTAVQVEAYLDSILTQPSSGCSTS